jgi:hypothetical protein
MNRGDAMMISQPALICLNATWQRLMRRSASVQAPAAAQILEMPIPADAIQGDFADAPEASLAVAAVGKPLAPEAQEQSSAVSSEIGVTIPLAANERRARAAALRAMLLSRERRFDSARTAFAEAADLDPALDLTRTPAFWKLERAAHEAAIEAYVQAGRDRDAAVLRARIQSTFRPKPLRPRSQVMLTR